MVAFLVLAGFSFLPMLADSRAPAHGTSVARAMAAESRRDRLYFAGYETLLSPGNHTLDVFKPRG